MYPEEQANSGYLNGSVCAIYDGNKYYIGTGPSFEYPKTVVQRQLAGEEAGFMTDIFGDNPKGRTGAIYALSDTRLYRDEIEEYAVMGALTQIVRKDLYEK